MYFERQDYRQTILFQIRHLLSKLSENTAKLHRFDMLYISHTCTSLRNQNESLCRLYDILTLYLIVDTVLPPKSDSDFMIC